MSRARILAIAVSAAVAIAGNVHDRAYYEAKFFSWLQNHGLVPENGDHFVKMLQNFANNDDIIEEHNSKNLPYTLGHNKFSHLSLDEWRDFVRLGLSRPEVQADAIHTAPLDMSAVPASVDWDAKGAVTDVKDQGQCGSCWSFSTTGAIEGAYQIKYGKLESFSEQMFVDCDNRSNGGKDKGCSGGLMDNAFAWAKKWGGVCTEEGYPYTSGKSRKEGTCNTSCAKNTNAAPKSFTDVSPNSDSAMMSALAIGPVSVAIEADQSAFQLYKSGVFTAACGTKLDHGVLAVGYGHDSASNLDYYRVKNSWGDAWGDGGFINLQKGGNMQKEGQCGILSSASYPVL